MFLFLSGVCFVKVGIMSFQSRWPPVVRWLPPEWQLCESGTFLCCFASFIAVSPVPVTVPWHKAEAGEIIIE